MLRHARKYLVLLLALLAAAYFIYKFRHAITLEGFRWSMVAESLHHARISLLLLGIGGIYVCFAIRALRWMRFSRALGRSRFLSVYKGTLMGFACLFLLGRAAEPIRPVLIARKDSLSMSGMFGIYVLERVFDMAATALLVVFALLAFERGGFAGPGNDVLMKAARSAGAFLLACLGGVIVFLIYFRYHGAGWLARKLHESRWHRGWREKIAVLLEGFSEGLRGIRTWGDLGVVSFYTTVHWALVVLVYLWILYAFPGRLSTLTFSGIVLVVAFTLVGSAAQLPVAGGGSQAATFFVLKFIFGVEMEGALVASIAVWLITFAACCLVGLPLLLREGWSMGELRRLAHAEEQAGQAGLLAEAERALDSPPQSPARPKVSLP